MSTVVNSLPITPSLLREFIGGDHQPTLLIRNNGDANELHVSRQSTGEAIVAIPPSAASEASGFSLEAALQHAGLAMEITPTSYLVTAHSVAELLATLKLAFNHLHWYDESSILGIFVAANGNGSSPR